MRAAKTVSLIGGFIYLFLWILFIYVSFRMYEIYAELDVGNAPLINQIVAHAISIGLIAINFGYFCHLRKKTNKREDVNHALLYSIIIAAVPLVIYITFMVVLAVFPVYITLINE